MRRTCLHRNHAGVPMARRRQRKAAQWRRSQHSIHHDVQSQNNPSGRVERRRARWRQEGARWTTKPSTERELEIHSAVRLEEEQVPKGALREVDVTELPLRPRTLDENDRLLTTNQRLHRGKTEQKGIRIKMQPKL